MTAFPPVSPADAAAANAYDPWAPYYDAIHATRPPHVAFYTGLIGPGVRRLLDMGCGTGSVTRAMAAAMRAQGPAQVAGFDLSERMIAAARAADPGIDWRVGDLRDPPFDGPFDLVTCTFHTMQVLQTDADMARCLAAVRGLLAADGRFAFDIYNPNRAWLARVPSGRVAHRFAGPDGRALRIIEDLSYDPGTEVLTGWWHLQDDATGAALDLPPLVHKVRQYAPDRLAALIAAAGLRVQQRWGDLDLTPWTDRARRQVLVLGRADPA
ncbi:MAG: class I SAM-dependent methyltransferase [Rhodobacterales bacterium]|nr:class I SAM-dependent methyltransferase [Rhodobacterales bacterium]